MDPRDLDDFMRLSVTHFDALRERVDDLEKIENVGSILDLPDVPDSYVGEAGRFLKVNAAETALEFTTGIFESAAGLIGIGTVIPGYSLDVYSGSSISTGRFNGTGNTTVLISSSGSNSVPKLAIENDAQQFQIRVAGNSGDKLFIRDETNTINRLTIDTAGFIGMGTDSPSYPLHVKSLGTGAGVIAAEASGTTNLLAFIFEDATGDGQLNLRNSSNSNRVVLHTNGNTYFTGGNVGIGTNAPAGDLDVYPSTGNARILLRSYDGNSYLDIRSNLDGGGADAAGIYFRDGGTAKFSILKNSANDLGFYDFTFTKTLMQFSVGGNMLITPQGDINFTPGSGYGNYDGYFTFIEQSSTPSNPAANTEATIYVRNDRLIIAWNEGGTMRYKYLTLSGTGVTWVYSAAAP